MNDPTAEVIAQATARAFEDRIAELHAAVLSQREVAERWRLRCSLAEAKCLELDSRGAATREVFYREKCAKLQRELDKCAAILAETVAYALGQEGRLAAAQAEILARREP